MSAADGSRIEMSRWQWRRLMRELARRGEGRRESGAFLLANIDEAGGTRSGRVRAWIAFDQLDPDCLNGAISIRGQAFSRLWAICRRRGMRVIADVHTHPGQLVSQSSIDAANPMIAQRGHIAVIVPDFARGRPRPADVGFHLYRGDRTWEAHYGDEAARRLGLKWW